MEMLSEHTLEGWFEGYVLTGRHGFFFFLRAFVHIIDSMFNQHAKWLEKSKLETRCGAYLLHQPADHLTGLAADHNGFTHQDPGFLDVVTTRARSDTHLSPAGCKLPAERDRPLPAQRQLRQRDRRRQATHLQYLT